MAEDIEAVGEPTQTEALPVVEDSSESEATAVAEAAVVDAVIEAAPASEEATPEPAPVVELPRAPGGVDAEFRPMDTAITPEREVDGYAYEVMYIVDPGCDQDQIKEVSERARQIIEADEGALDNVRTSQVRRLAYEIKGRRDGIYVVLNLRAKPAVTRELDRMLKLQDRALRHMILRTDR